MQLCNETLGHLNGRITQPTYDRARLKPGILHIGVGNFHRAHLALYCNDLLNAGGSLDWGIRGAGVRETDTAMRDKLAPQDWMFTVSETDGTGFDVAVAGAMMDFVPVMPDHDALIAAVADPETKIVSLTVTEGGYYLNSGGEFDDAHPDISHDLQGDTPKTVFGVIARGLAARMAASLPVTVMSCDNLPGNGDIARAAVLGVISDPKLAAWVAAHVTFPNGMVDRITPATTPEQIATLTQDFAIEDSSPVFCEPFRQWVVEDRFAAGRPDWQNVGVTFTDHVHTYERLKIRVLNGGHAIIAYPAGLLGIHFVHDAMKDENVAQFLHATEVAEILPLVEKAGLTPDEYLDLTAKRFANPGVGDTIRRLCLDGTNRQPKFIVATIAENLAAGRVPVHLAMLSALWARYCLGKTEAGETIAPNDPEWDARQTAARQAETDPASWLDQASIYGETGKHPGFCGAFVKAYELIRDKGVAQAISAR
ncbi:MAG: mannitol dehydrogenase family protein [Deltaproteobacteria bacterium]